jgi:hypothetical protein
MSFEDKIIQHSGIKQAKLMRPAKIASEKPDTGVVIENKSAYFVIRDCADITQKYLALLCYGSYQDPINKLHGKFTKQDIAGFVSRARAPENPHLKHLLYVIFTDIARKEGLYEQVAPNQPAALDLSEDADDIYGEYDYDPDTVNAPASPQDIPFVDMNISDDKAVVTKLVDVFGAVK